MVTRGTRKGSRSLHPRNQIFFGCILCQLLKKLEKRFLGFLKAQNFCATLQWMVFLRRGRDLTPLPADLISWGSGFTAGGCFGTAGPHYKLCPSPKRSGACNRSPGGDVGGPSARQCLLGRERGRGPEPKCVRVVAKAAANQRSKFLNHHVPCFSTMMRVGSRGGGGPLG